MAKGSVVRSQMPGGSLPGMKGVPGVYDRNEAPFDKPHDLGHGGIPLKMYEDHGVKPASAKIAGTKNAALSYGNGQSSQQTGGSSRPIAKAHRPGKK